MLAASARTPRSGSKHGHRRGQKNISQYFPVLAMVDGSSRDSDALRACGAALAEAATRAPVSTAHAACQTEGLEAMAAQRVQSNGAREELEVELASVR